jgi:hypothetical protein
MDARNQVVPLHLFHRLELETALGLKVFRGEMDEARRRAVLDEIGADIGKGRVVLRPADWVAAMDAARRIGEAVTARAGCRALDLLHIAVALQWESEVFVTADDRQLKAARAAGLRTVDMRTPSARDRAGREVGARRCIL